LRAVGKEEGVNKLGSSYFPFGKRDFEEDNASKKAVS
jgi:hypothetical protein